MNKIAASLLLAVLATTVTSPVADARAWQTDEPSGKAIFDQNKCSKCHSIGSQGILRIGAKSAGKKLPTDLSTVGKKHTAEWMQKYLVRDTKMKGKKHLQKFAGSPDDLMTLTAWLGTLQPSNPVPTSKAAPVAKVDTVKKEAPVKKEVPAKEVPVAKEAPVKKEAPISKAPPSGPSPGKALFAAQNCAKCHSVVSQGIARLGPAPSGTGTQPPDLSGVGLKHTVEWMKGWLMKEEEMNGKKHLKKFSGSDDELNTLTSWLASLKKK